MIKMKKFFPIILAAVLCMAACTKNEITVSEMNEITFKTASMLTKAGFTGTAFPTTETFGVYAWTDNTTGPYFMDNEVVSYDAQSDQWKTSTTYYWPKGQSVDFIMFYPARMSGITVEENKITYSNYTVGDTDLMYADKAVAYTDNVNEVSDDTNSARQGVPAIFHHALAKVQVNVKLGYNHKAEDDGTVTDWEVKLNSAKLSGVYKTGDCILSLSDEAATGTVAWNKPTGNVWTSAGEAQDLNDFTEAAVLSTTDNTKALSETFVLPQALTQNGQKIELNITIKTTRNGQLFLTETMDISADLYLATLPSWEMNNSIVYNIVVNPTKSDGNGGQGGGGTPTDPNDPDLSDATIIFDPAVDGWNIIDVGTTLVL